MANVRWLTPTQISYGCGFTSGIIYQMTREHAGLLLAIVVCLACCAVAAVMMVAVETAADGLPNP